MESEVPSLNLLVGVTLRRSREILEEHDLSELHINEIIRLRGLGEVTFLKNQKTLKGQKQGYVLNINELG